MANLPKSEGLDTSLLGPSSCHVTGWVNCNFPAPSIAISDGIEGSDFPQMEPILRVRFWCSLNQRHYGVDAAPQFRAELTPNVGQPCRLPKKSAASNEIVDAQTPRTCPSISPSF